MSSHNKAINLNIQNYVLPYPVVPLLLQTLATLNCSAVDAYCSLPLSHCRRHCKDKLPYSFALLKHKIFKNLFQLAVFCFVVFASM